MKKIVVIIAVLGITFGLKAQDETVNGKLTINGNLNQNIAGTPSTWFYQIQSSNQNSGFWANSGNPALYLRDNSGNLNAVVRPDGKSYFKGGNVGIGTNNPSALLELFSAKSTDHWVTRMNTNGSNWSGFWEASDNISLILRDTDGNADISLVPNGSSYINGGNLGIGTSTPLGKLDIHQGGVTLSTPNQGIANGVHLNGISWVVDDNSAGRVSEQAAAIRFIGTGTWNGSVSPSLLSFETIGLAGGGTLQRMIINQEGYVGIGTATPDSRLTVAGNIHSQEVKVTVNAGADFVFENDYNLPSLESIEKYIQQNKHLPEIASEKEMKENGLLLAEMNIKLLQKIEELTLYIIQQQKDIIEQKNKVEKYAKEIESLKFLENKFEILLAEMEKLKVAAYNSKYN